MKSEAPQDMAKKRKRRTIEELIADLEAEKEDLLARLKAQELKTSPAHKLALAAVKHIDKSAALATQEGETQLRHVLAEAREKLVPYLEERGVRLPKLRRPRGPRPKDKEKE
jgi:hypothetical protein